MHYNINRGVVKDLTVYIDVLIILNVYVNYFLLKTTAKLTHSPLKALRCIAASFYGSLFSLMILAPKMPVSVTLIIKLIAAVTIVITAFGIHHPKRILKNTLTFFTVNFIFAGAIYGVYSWLKPRSMHFANSFFYIDFSLLLLLITTGILYAAVSLLRRFTDNTNSEKSHVIIRTGDRIINIDGLADTGNALVDFFTGKPVVICGRKEIGTIKAKMRLIPCSTISDNGIIPIFHPDEVIIINDITGERKPVDVMIGIGKSEGMAIYNPKIIKY